MGLEPLMASFPRVRVGATTPDYTIYKYDRNEVRFMESVFARADIRGNLMYYKVQIVNAIGHMLSTTSPKPLDRVVTLTGSEIEEIANRIADWYIRSVDEFLASNWGARPKQGTRNFWLNEFGIQNVQNHPWCDDWATYLLEQKHDILDTEIMVGNQTMPLNQLLVAERVQWHSWPRQHNYILFRPYEYKVANPLFTDSVILLFDPWITISPQVYSTKNHPYPGKNTGVK